MTDKEYDKVYPGEGTSDIGQEFPYLNNVKADPRLIGLGPIQNPFADKVSSQRAMMWGSHFLQHMVIHGHEQPRVFTGFDSIVGEYEHDTTSRDQDVQILRIIPKYEKDKGINPIRYNPSFTIVYQRTDGVVDYFNLDKYTLRSKGYGYENHWIREAINNLQEGTILPKETKLYHSLAHEGEMYEPGVNLKTCYMSLPGVTEDAFIISESAAKKLESDAYGQIVIEISPDQLPLNLYGDEDEYKFMPEIGEHVRDDGILMALRKPTADSIIYDTAPSNLGVIQDLHDDPFYIPQGSQIVDIKVVRNNRCKQKFSEHLYEQLEKYLEGSITYSKRIYSAYKEAEKEGKRISEKFNTLVKDALETLLVNNEIIPGYTRNKNSLTLARKKKEIRFIYMVITYKHKNHVRTGFKLAGRYGN